MPGIGPITNMRTLVGAIAETIGKLEELDQTPRVVRLLERCRHYSSVVSGWATAAPPPDEQFETIGHIMQLLSAAMSAARDDERPIVVRPELPPELDELTDVTAHESLPARGSHRSHVLALYLLPWRDLGDGLAVKVLRQNDASCHALLRLRQGATLPGHTHASEEHVLVLEGCIRHGEMELYAGIRSDGGYDSAPFEAVGEATLLLISSDRGCLMR
jgi:anti-sigma factor ChrR (cupin superfamily)